MIFRSCPSQAETNLEKKFHDDTSSGDLYDIESDLDFSFSKTPSVSIKVLVDSNMITNYQIATRMRLEDCESGRIGFLNFDPMSASRHLKIV
jgi:hypothetical protein